MARYTNPVPKYTDSSGDFMPYGLLYFYNSGTLDDKTTYADSAQTIANTQPLILNGDGSTPNCFYSGAAKVILVTNAGTQAAPIDGTQQWERDPVANSTLAPIAWGVYNFGTDTLTFSSGCTVVRSSVGLAILTLDSPLTNTASAISLMSVTKGSINFTSASVAIFNTQLGSDVLRTGTIANGSTTDVIAHSYSSDLTIDGVVVTPTETLGSASYLYINAVDASNITIGCDVDPGKDVDFSLLLRTSSFNADITNVQFTIYDGGNLL